MNILSEVDSSSIEDTFRIVKVLCLGRDDVRTADVVAPYGVDSNPIQGMSAIYADTADSEQPVIVGYINQDQLAASGEVRLYATDDDAALQTYLWLKKDGTMELGGNADHAVRYSKLEAAFNQLKSDFNNLVTLYNAHTHPVPNATPATPATPSTADITPAKIEEIKTA